MSAQSHSFPLSRLNWRMVTGRTAQILIGIIFLTAGAAKAWEPILFSWNVFPYVEMLASLFSASWKDVLLLHWHALAVVSLAVIPLEVTLGIALLLNWRPRLVLPASLVFMLGFLLLMLLAWKMGVTEDCGCFGSLLKRSPGVAIIEDLVILTILPFGYLAAGAKSVWKHSGLLVLLTLLIFLILGGTRLVSQLDRLGDSDLRRGVHLTGLHPQGEPLDLQTVDLLLELISPTCSHCGVSVGLMNDYLATHPSLRAISFTVTPQDTPELRFFREWWHPHFPIITISRTDFLRLTSGHQTPRLALLRHGVIVSVWERDEFPSPEQLSDLLSGSITP